MRTRNDRRRLEIALVLLVLAACGLLVQENAAQSASRLALTAAVAEHGTVVIDDYEATLGVDYAEKDGHLYSDKAPGQPLAAVPFWGAYRLVGGEAGTVLRVEHNLGLWWLTFWFAAVPGALLLVALRRHAAALTGGADATVAALLLFFGTILLPFSTLLFGHILAALLAFLSFTTLRRAMVDEDGTTSSLLALSGLAAGAAVLVEYTVALAVAVLCVAAIAGRGRRGLWFVAGMVPPGTVAAAYHTVAFGDPLAHPYRYSVFAVHHDTFVGMGRPDPDLFLTVLFGERGLFTSTPVVAMAVVGLVLSQRRGARAVDVWVPAAVLAGYLVFASSWIDATGGHSPGARHVLPAIPFLIGGLATTLRRWPALTVACGILGGAVMAVATLTEPMMPAWRTPAIRIWLDRLWSGDVVDTVLSSLVGRAGLLFVAIGVVGAGHLVLVRARAFQEPAPEGLSSPAPSRA